MSEKENGMADKQLLRTATTRVEGIEAVEEALRGEPGGEIALFNRPHIEGRVVIDSEMEQTVAAQVENVLAAQRRNEEEARRAADAQRGIEDEALRQVVNAVLTTIRLQGREPILSRHDAAMIRDMWERACRIRKTVDP